MKLSAAQWAIINQGQHHDFLSGVFHFFYARHPTQEADQDSLRDMARLVDRAKGYGLHTQDQWFTYLHAAYLLGRSFDRNPQYPWAAAILQDQDTVHKSDRLFKSAWLQFTINQRLKEASTP